MKHYVKIVCTNKHSQTIEVQHMTREMVEDFAALMDGTSPFFVRPSLPGSKLHKCGICGSPIKAEVSELRA